MSSSRAPALRLTVARCRRALLPALLVLSTWLAPAGPLAAARDTHPRTPVVDGTRCAQPAGLVQLQAEQWAGRHAQLAPGPERAQVAAALGRALARLNQPEQAIPLLQEALAGQDDPRARAAAALDLGNLHLSRQDADGAEAAWAQALHLAPGDAELALAVELNRVRLAAPAARLRRLQAAARSVEQLPADLPRTRHSLNLASQARALGAPGVALALRLYEAGRDGSLAAADDALAAEAYDGLAALYEQQGRLNDALRLTERGLRHAARVAERDLAVPLEWRAGRLARAQGDEARALSAFRRAVDHVEAVRADLPVQYVDGRSSFRDTLEPVYLGLTDLLLRESQRQDGEARGALLRQARDTVELIKQTELEDYLRDRCSLGAARRAAAFTPPAATAIYYPVILPDRLALLVETPQGIQLVDVPVTGRELRLSVLNFVAALRSGGGYRQQAERLYDWLLRPVQALLDSQGVQTLVAVPDGVLRLLPLAALHDGQDFAIRRWALATAPGLTMTLSGGPADRPVRALLAGMSVPGPVLDKLPQPLIAAMLEGAPESVQARAGTAAARNTPGPTTPAVREALRDALALPGVRREVQDIGRLLQGTALLDQRFTRAALQAELARQDHEVVHIASHGVFGDSADSTFIMTYDELLTLDGLQQLLGTRRRSAQPVELITLSACQTAEGDDRAPLGMSGTALKARARSALGTLWVVSDDATQQLMAGFYRRLVDARASGRGGKIDALRAAQLALIDQAAFQHPFFWAPFILVGDWQ